MKISLCMIVKDEEAVLARCLQSAKDVADELIIVDTGSTDGTKKIAEAFGRRFSTMNGRTILPLPATFPFRKRWATISYGWTQTIFSPPKAPNAFPR